MTPFRVVRCVHSATPCDAISCCSFVVYTVQCHVTLFRVASEHVHKSYFISLCNVHTTAAACRAPSWQTPSYRWVQSRSLPVNHYLPLPLPFPFPFALAFALPNTLWLCIPFVCPVQTGRRALERAIGMAESPAHLCFYSSTSQHCPVCCL